MEGEQPYLGDLLTMVINHLLSGMILQVVFEPFWTPFPRTVLTFARGILMSAVHKLIETTVSNLFFSAEAISWDKLLLEEAKSLELEPDVFESQDKKQFAESNRMMKMQVSTPSRSTRFTKSVTSSRLGEPTFELSLWLVLFGLAENWDSSQQCNCKEEPQKLFGFALLKQSGRC